MRAKRPVSKADLSVRDTAWKKNRKTTEKSQAELRLKAGVQIDNLSVRFGAHFVG
jgi:hypothetical protein